MCVETGRVRRAAAGAGEEAAAADQLAAAAAAGGFGDGCEVGWGNAGGRRSGLQQSGLSTM